MSNDIENTENNNANVSEQLLSDKNKSCENSSELQSRLLGLADLASELRNLSIFLASGVESFPSSAIQELQDFQHDLILKVDSGLCDVMKLNSN